MYTADNQQYFQYIGYKMVEHHQKIPDLILLSLYWHCIATQQVYLKLNHINHWQGKAAGKSYSPRELPEESKICFSPPKSLRLHKI